VDESANRVRAQESADPGEVPDENVALAEEQQGERRASWPNQPIRD